MANLMLPVATQKSIFQMFECPNPIYWSGRAKASQSPKVDWVQVESIIARVTYKARKLSILINTKYIRMLNIYCNSVVSMRLIGNAERSLDLMKKRLKGDHLKLWNLRKDHFRLLRSF